MPLRTDTQYKQGLKDDRNVYILGNKVNDVTRDPFIKVGVETAAFDFILGHDPEYKDISVMPSPFDQSEISSYFDVPDYPEAVEKRFNLVKTASHYTDAALPFVKDVGTDIMNGLLAVTQLMGNKTYVDRINDYRWYCAKNDLSIAGAVTDVKGDRSKSPSEQDSPDYYLRVIDETDSEIVVSGAKAHITASPYVDEIIVIPTRNMTEAESDYAIAFAIPANTKGITHVCRPNFRYEDRYHFPTPRPKRGHLEALVIFDNVRVPKSRVFMLRDWQFSQAIAYAFSAFHRFTAVTYKIPILEHMTGLGMLVAEANGIEKASHVRERFIDMIRYTEITKSLAKAAIASPENFYNSGYFVANRLQSNMAKLYFASNFHEFIRCIQDLAGGLLVTQPTYKDWQHEALNPYFQKYLGGSGAYSAENRMKLMSYLHHVAASDFAGWHEVCTIHAEGSFAAQKMMLYAEAPMDMYKEQARQIVGLPSDNTSL
jgi:4-hydroxybutyryl-CoA dehydratase/vinylacetyl-CoA-Delta-isomerase